MGIVGIGAGTGADPIIALFTREADVLRLTLQRPGSKVQQLENSAPQVQHVVDDAIMAPFSTPVAPLAITVLTGSLVSGGKVTVGGTPFLKASAAVGAYLVGSKVAVNARGAGVIFADLYVTDADGDFVIESPMPMDPGAHTIAVDAQALATGTFSIGLRYKAAAVETAAQMLARALKFVKDEAGGFDEAHPHDAIASATAAVLDFDAKGGFA